MKKVRVKGPLLTADEIRPKNKDVTVDSVSTGLKIWDYAAPEPGNSFQPVCHASPALQRPCKAARPAMQLDSALGAAAGKKHLMPLSSSQGAGQ